MRISWEDEEAQLGILLQLTVTGKRLRVLFWVEQPREAPLKVGDIVCLSVSAESTFHNR